MSAAETLATRAIPAEKSAAEKPRSGIFLSQIFLSAAQTCANTGRAQNAEHQRWVNREQREESVWFVTPLHHALSGEHKDVVEFLLCQGAIIKPYSELLLEIALRRGRRDLLELLFKHGASARSLGGADLPLESPELTELLVKHGADVNKRAWGDWPPVAYLARGDKGEHPEKLKTLLDLGADVHACNPRGVTAMHAAAKAGFISVLQILLEYGADINAKTKDGSTPLALALEAKRKKAADFLAKHGGKR